MARKDRVTGSVIGPGQRLDAETALRLFTTAGAMLTFDEDWKGPLKRGYAADVAVLSACPLDLDADAVFSLKCYMTIVGGQIVHSE
ncbi:amidohydrolase family protein, partial [Enterococcus faecium]|uniref:amidohydrolase family protein n=1 Tax=Enterococcus faecium TaxID=1352 RepID=UPI0034E945C0